MNTIKINLFFIFYFLFFTSSHLYCQQTETNPDGFNRFYYGNGKVSSEGYMREGKPDGYWKTYFESGKIKSEGNRKNFQLDSTWKFYNEEGVLVLEYYYKNGKKNGLRKNYDAKDKFLLSEENYADDIKQGVSKFYYRNGKEKQSIPFVDNREEGLGYEYDTMGTVISLFEYKAGFIKRQEKINRRDKAGLKQGMWKEFYLNGNVKNECMYLEDKRNGYLKEYGIKGELLNTTKYENDKVVENAPELARLDTKTEYYEGAIVKSTGTYKNGIPEGAFREFSIDGKITSSKIFKDGILVGEGIYDEANKEQGHWKEYHVNGQLKAEGEYKDGKHIGEWTFYHPNGKVEQKGKYDRKGNAQGQWKWYYETGHLLREENYMNNVQDGLMIEYSDSGNVITKGHYADGQKEDEWIYEMGDYKEVGKYRTDRRTGVWKHFYTPGGKLRFEGNYIDGNPDGKHVYYYPNGKKQQEGKYIMGRKEGNWEYWNEEGIKMLTILYKDDVEIKYDGVKIKLVQAEGEKK
ncbi:MAG: toxin-antitoxin system YwqK family antitoxin [Bacteroidia bacterium]|nr:toxin-antitoxin system YwqK family antitoxin [Bacteroidia bacterium]